MKDKCRWKKAGVLALAAVMAGTLTGFPHAGVLTSYALEAETPLGAYTEEELASFKDNTLEYREIQGLVEYYNPAYLNQLEIFNGMPDDSINLSREQLLLMAANFREQASDLKEEMEDAEDSLSKEALQEYKDNIKTLKSYAGDMEEAADGTASTRRTLRIERNRQVVALREQMRTYQQQNSLLEIAKKSQESAELAFASAKRQQELGLYSAEDLARAERGLMAAKAETDAAAAALLKTKQSLITAMGWSYDAEPEILPIPEPDTAKIAEYDLNADTELAMGSNYDIIEIRRTDKSEYGGTFEKQEKIEEAETQVRMQMEFLYRDVCQKQTAYENGRNSLAVAESKMAMAERKYSLGMISYQEYLTEEIAWMNAQASFEQTSLALLKAMEAYEWAITGLMIQ